MSLSGPPLEITAHLRHGGRRDGLRVKCTPARHAAILALAFVLACTIALMPAVAAAQTSTPTGDFELGAVVDVRRVDPAGLRVMAVTPGGAADRIGLRAGDRLQAINGQRLAGMPEPASKLAQALRAGGGVLQVDLLRDGKPVGLSGPADLHFRVARAGCGQVTDLISGLPANSNVQRVDIVQIEGRGTPPIPASRYPVASGMRVLIVREHVPSQRPPERSLSSYGRKAFVLDIEPDMTYYIGAKPLTGGGMEGAWQPFVWQSVRESCP